MREFVPATATISSPCGQGVLIGGVLLGIVCMLYNMMGCMVVGYDAEVVKQCYDAKAMMQCCDAEAMISIGP